MLSFQSVEKQFNKIKAVDNLSFDVNRGEIFALLGPNGAGKTTSVRMIMQIIEPDSGTVSFDASFQENGRVNRSRLGYLPEDRGLYQDVPLMKTLLYLASLRGCEPKTTAPKAAEWLKRFDIYDRRHDKISSLSKGNQQKIQFIASILHEPDFAVLDEPFSGFDPINQELISDVIRELRDAGMTILLSAHQMELVEKIADRILMIHQGRELLSGTLAEIRSRTVSGQKLVVEYRGDVATERLKNSPVIQSIEPKGSGTWEIFWSDGAEMNQVLSEITSAGTIASLQTSDVTLHEIFIQSFTKKESEL